MGTTIQNMNKANAPAVAVPADRSLGGVLEKVGQKIKDLFNPPEPQWVKDAWDALTPHEQYSTNRMAFPWMRICTEKDWTDAYADIISNRGDQLPSSPDKYYDALTPPERRMVEFAVWRHTTRRIVTWADYGNHYKDLAATRDQPFVKSQSGAGVSAL